MKINIAIDGPSAAGKSTIAKKLANKLNYVHLDTGAMYRCTAYKAEKNGLDFTDGNAVAKMLQDTEIRLTPEGNVYLDGENVSKIIREDHVSLAASKVSQHPSVREELVRRQQNMAKAKGFIMDGRDIGTVVLKDAEVKIFMTASAEARAKRRYDQNIQSGIETESLEVITEEIKERDYQDIHREASPLRKAEDAIEIDTSYLSIDEVSDKIYEIAKPFLEKEDMK